MCRNPCFAVILAALWLLCAAGPAAALTLDPKPERAPVRLPGDLFGGQAPTEGLLRVKTAVRKVKYSRVLETAPLTFATGSGAAEGQSAVHDLALTTAEGQSGLAFGRYNEVALDLRDVDPDNPTLAALTVRAPDGRTFASDPLECVERLGEAYLRGTTDTVPVAKAGWADKNVLYLARRFLDLPFDALWRTTEDGPSTFLQRRFDRDALDLGAVDVVLRRPAPVQVNLVVALDPAHPRARTVLDWYGLSKRTFELPDGRTVLRVYVGRYLREHFAGLKTVRLKEISLMFFRQGTAEVARDRLVERLAFIPSGLDPAALARDGLPGRLATRVREPFPGTKRVFVNVRAAAAAMGEGGRATANLRLTPMAADLPGGATPEGGFLALVSPRRETPAFLAAADELASGLGAAWDIDRADGGRSVTPLWSLPDPFADGHGRARDRKSDAAVSVFTSGAKDLFQAEGGVRLYRSAAGLSVEGRAPRLTMPVAVSFVPTPDTDYFFRLDIGRAPGLSGVFLDVSPAGRQGPAKSYALRPGLPTPLTGLPAAVAGATLRFEFSGREFALPLSRAMLTAVTRGKPHEDLYAARLPWPVTTAGIPQTEAKAGWRFVPTTPLGRLAWFSTAYALTGDPVAVSIDGGAPATPDTRSGILAGRLPDGAMTASLAVSGLGGAAPGQLEFTAPAFSGEALVDWRTLFAASPVVALNGASVRPGQVSEETARRLHEAESWLDLGPVSLPAKAARARFFQHPWYGVTALCFETGQAVPLSQFAAPPKAGSASGHLGTLARALAALALLAGAVLGLRLAGRQRLVSLAVRPARWLAAFPGDPAVARRQLFASLGASAALAASGLTLGTVPGRVALGLAGVALVPVWRVLAPAAAARLSRRSAVLGAWLAADPGRLYFLGFALALILAAGLRSLTLTRPAEFCVQAGLYVFLAGAYLEIVPGRPDALPLTRGDGLPRP